VEMIRLTMKASILAQRSFSRRQVGRAALRQCKE
jgi:hypothetical protein